ncbi:HlyD family efflux transporter periplasmic adaptor subunit [Legionella fairfieldensis]|uniref:HlyD family efflux transporter periplasmic adaptor subunit n=1 Tax=Legionella fairfieldensis TaxID=45064 RepID=UPI00056215DC|nr:HlyD family efflux transporter periplasmic adaptor subunit [Legionella fairfieldensis]
MNKNSLFRQEVIDNKRYANWGSVFINTPVKYQFVSGVFLMLVIVLIVFICFGEFSEKYIVYGYVNSRKGIVRVFPNKNGIIKKSNVYHGKKVKKNEVLFVIDTSYDYLNKNQDNDILYLLKKRKKYYENEINYKLYQLNKLKKLLEKKYISLDSFNQKHEEIASLKNSLNMIDMDLIKYKKSRSYIIKAPITGTIASISYKTGQYINLTKPLLKILPVNSDLEVELFIPIRKSGFIHKNSNVIIRYDAYPYERFGTYKAVIKDISQSILTDEEEDKPIRIKEPYYKATALLQSESVFLYGKKVKVQDGMTITGIVLGAKRKVWQWILDPIYSFYGGATV